MSFANVLLKKNDHIIKMLHCTTASCNNSAVVSVPVCMYDSLIVILGITLMHVIYYSMKKYGNLYGTSFLKHQQPNTLLNMEYISIRTRHYHYQNNILSILKIHNCSFQQNKFRYSSVVSWSGFLQRWAWHHMLFLFFLFQYNFFW